jgi:hypothetical protein
MLLQAIKKTTQEFLAKLAAGDVARIDDALFIITEKAEWLGEQEYLRRKIEDHELVFETDFHTFSWWEVCNEIGKIDEQQWQVGEHTISFLGLVPA